jgi:tetratricopeptide (TPR) repeat protein
MATTEQLGKGKTFTKNITSIPSSHSKHNYYLLVPTSSFFFFSSCRYEEAIQAHPSNNVLRALYSNCSLAYAKALRFQDALHTADKAIEVSPTWAKGYWRRGTALIGLQNNPAAVDAFFKCWELQPQDAESYKKLAQTIRKLTREQLGAAILDIFENLEKEKKLVKAVVEATEVAAMKEAAFRLIADSHRSHPSPGPYYSTVLRWRTQGVDPAEAYAVRAAVHHNAKCFLQARKDAQQAIKLFFVKLNGQKDGASISDPVDNSETKATITKDNNSKAKKIMFSNKDEVLAALAAAYSRLGDAYLAEPNHPDRDPISAFKSYTRATDYDLISQELRNKLQHATEELSKEQVEKAALEIYNQPEELIGGGSSSFGSGIDSVISGSHSSVGELRPGERIFRVEAVLAFPQATPGKLNSKIREAIRKALATVAIGNGKNRGDRDGEEDTQDDVTSTASMTTGSNGTAIAMAPSISLNISAVTLEGVFPARPPTRQSLEISIHIVVGPKLLHGNALVKILRSKDLEKIQRLIGGEDVVAALGAPDVDLCRAELVDSTPTYIDATNGGGNNACKEEEIIDTLNQQLAVPSKPKLDLEVPYKMYRLVTSNGTPIERTDKHPFAMSRVYYNASEKPEEVWVELADGSCRWRQTAGEIKIIALKVPPNLPPRELKVDISPYHLKIYRQISEKKKTSGRKQEKGILNEEGEGKEIFLQGRLHRGIIPEDCFWTHCGGDGDDGCCITLQKMNLEVLQKHWAHSESWWVRLFQEHQDIRWDDYEKDYSDLPEEVLEKYRTTEAIKDVERSLEQTERHRREVLQERDDLRKRKRQERLHVLRTGVVKDWVHLNREG